MSTDNSIVGAFCVSRHAATGSAVRVILLLQHNAHLTHLRIAKSHWHLPTAELAFLAARNTAEITITEDGAPDEVLHLTAAMELSGFRSLIGTMWAMIDEDG